MAADEVKCLCGSCQKVVQDRHNAVFCYGKCKKWWHIACASVLKTHYDHFKCIADKMPGLKWFCTACESSVVTGTRADSVSGTNPRVDDENDNSAIMNIVVSELSDISKNYLTLSQRLLALGDENKAMKEQLFEISNHLSINTRSSSSSSEVSTHDVSSYAAKVKVSNECQATDVIQAQQGSNKQTNPGSLVSGNIVKASSSAVATSYSEIKKTQIGNKKNRTKSVPAVNNATQPLSGLSSANVTDEGFSCSVDDFKEVKYDRKLRKENKPEGNRPRRKSQGQFLTGSRSKDVSLSVVENKKYRYLFVSRFSTSVDCESLEKYIKDEVEGDFSVEQLKNRYPDYHSFKVGVPIAHWNKVFVSDFWPQGVYISRFWFSRNRNEGLRSQSGNSFLEEGQNSVSVT